jgi:FkbM family methyltransferase
MKALSRQGCCWLNGDRVSAFLKVASFADRLGLRGLVARGASAAYRDSRFTVDQDGRWVNRQPEATFVSPIFHTTRYSAVREWVLYNWAWQYMPRPGDTIIDVGAGIGEEAVIFSQLVGETGRVVSIEAHPSTFACLERTIKLSGLSNVHPVFAAVADQDGELFISDTDEHLTNSVIGRSEGICVPARTLDSIADQLAVEKVALLKMNIEGAERLAVKGMERLAPLIEHAVISCHDFLADRGSGGDEFRTSKEVRAELERLGFHISMRPDADEAWVRDYLHASRPGNNVA